MIIDKISMIKLEILSNMGKKLAKAYSFSNFNTTVFRSLPIVIIIGDFYQFFLITSCFF